MLRAGTQRCPPCLVISLAPYVGGFDESSKRTRVYKDPKDLEHYIDGMRKAGLPES